MNTKRLRTIIPLAVIAVVAVGFATHVGVGTLSAIGWQDISLLCPLGALMTMIATKTMIPRAVISVVIAIALILLFARAFCGWVCPVPVVSKIPRHLLEEDLEHRHDRHRRAARQREPPGEGRRGHDARRDGAGAAAEPAPLSADEQAALKGLRLEGRLLLLHAEKRAALDSRHVILGGSAFVGGRVPGSPCSASSAPSASPSPPSCWSCACSPSATWPGASSSCRRCFWPRWCSSAGGAAPSAPSARS
ncbi:MAG: 4Fe-4S binding protein [Adlercreutzia equolifaciens]